MMSSTRTSPTGHLLHGLMNSEEPIETHRRHGHRGVRADPQVEQVFIDPVRPVSLIAGQGDRPCHRRAVPIGDPFVGTHQQRHDGGGLVGLAGRQMEVERVAMTVTEQVDFRGKPAAGAS